MDKRFLHMQKEINQIGMYQETASQGKNNPYQSQVKRASS